jgi:hypothetical protein
MRPTFQPDEPQEAGTPSPSPPIRLGIIHLIVWMASCAASLAILRLSTDESQLPPEYLLSTRLTHAIVGIAYGTALGGLLLLVYRRVWHGAKFPSQPGHWLFLLGTIGLLLDGGALLAARLAARWWNPPHGLPFPEYWFYQTLGWSLGAAIGAVALWYIARSQPRRWTALAVCVWLAVVTNAVTHSLPLARELSGVSIPWLFGTWFFGTGPYYYAALLRLCGDALCLAMLLIAVVIEFRLRIPRDWLHWSGVFAGAALPLVDAANRTWDLLTNW